MNLHDVVLENARDLARRGLVSAADLARIERNCLTARHSLSQRKSRETKVPVSCCAA